MNLVKHKMDENGSDFAESYGLSYLPR